MRLSTLRRIMRHGRCTERMMGKRCQLWDTHEYWHVYHKLGGREWQWTWEPKPMHTVFKHKQRRGY